MAKTCQEAATIRFWSGVGGSTQSAAADEEADEEGQREGPEVAEPALCRKTECLRGWRLGREWGGVRDGLARLDDGAVRALRDLDEERIGVAFAGVVLAQPRAEAAGFNADGVVDG